MALSLGVASYGILKAYKKATNSDCTRIERRENDESYSLSKELGLSNYI